MHASDIDREARLLADEDRGRRAETLLSDPLLKEAFAAVERAYVDTWKGTASRDGEARELVFRHVRTLENVKAHIESVVRTGVLARERLADLRPEKGGWFFGR